MLCNVETQRFSFGCVCLCVSIASSVCVQICWSTVAFANSICLTLDACLKLIAQWNVTQIQSKQMRYIFAVGFDDTLEMRHGEPWHTGIRNIGCGTRPSKHRSALFSQTHISYTVSTRRRSRSFVIFSQIYASKNEFTFNDAVSK